MANHLKQVSWESELLARTIFLCHFIMECLEYVHIYEQVDYITPISWQQVPDNLWLSMHCPPGPVAICEMLFKRRIMLSRKEWLYSKAQGTCTVILLLGLVTDFLVSLSVLGHKAHEARQQDMLKSHLQFLCCLLGCWALLKMVSLIDIDRSKHQAPV